MELQLVSLEDEEEEQNESAGEEADAVARDELGPKSVLDIDWNELGARMGGQAMGLGRYKFACFLTNEVTMTGDGLWCIYLSCMYAVVTDCPFSLSTIYRRRTRRAPSGATPGPGR